MSRPRLSIVVVGYEMSRELPRTIESLSPRLQRGVSAADYEVIVVDNGSRTFDPGAIEAVAENVRAFTCSVSSASPVHAINQGLAACQGDLVGVMIDGARLCTPGMARDALAAARTHDRPVIGTLGFHLGPDVQMRSVQQGYDQQEEDRLLEQIRWREDPYRLYSIAALAGSSAGGFFRPLAESNALFMPASLWTELGGYDEAFQSPGGGLVNLDVWDRACSLPGAQPIMLLGEATFHQVHGGIATNSPEPPMQAFKDEFQALRGRAFVAPAVDMAFYGRVHPGVLKFLEHSVTAALQAERQ